MNKKICQIGYLKFGIGHYIAHLYPYLSSIYDVKVVTFTHGSIGDELVMDDEIVNNNVTNYAKIINPHGLRNTSDSINKLFNLFEKEKFSILNLHISSYTRKSSYVFIPIIEYFKRQGLKVVYTIHDVLPTPENVDPTLFLNYYYNLSDLTIVGNINEKNDLTKHFAYKKDIYIATHGIYALFNRNKITKEQARKQLNIDSNSKVLLFFGILRENKGLDDLIKALNILKNNSEYILIIALSERMGFTFLKYQQLLDEYKLNSQVRLFIKNEASVVEIECYFKACDLLILPYTSTSQSGILNLGFAFKKPVILSNMFAEANFINGKMGLVIEPKNPYQMTVKIKEFFHNQKNTSQQYQENIESYNQKHSFQHTAKVYLKVFNRIFNNH